MNLNSYPAMGCEERRAVLTIAAVEVGVGAGGAVLRAELEVGVEVVGHGGVPLLARRLLVVQRHFSTFYYDVMDLKSLPPA